jgi:DNA-directed RNA polymerase specialized sigma24 family protein
MTEPVARAAGAVAAPMVEHDRLDHVISRVAAGDRVAFRRLYAFMAMRIWRIVVQAPLGPADAVAVTRSTFVEVWHSARAATHYDARNWMATVTTGRINDRLRLVDASVRHRVHPAEPVAGADHRHQPPTVVDHDTHVHRELTALLGAGAATIRTGPGVFARIDDLDQALATIAAATQAAATGLR